MTDISSGTDGLLIKMDSPPPTNCANTPYGWLLISQTDKVMIATALSMWLSGQRTAVIYTNAALAGSMCIVNQFDPG